MLEVTLDKVTKGQNALVLGSGSGVDAVALAKKGLTVGAVDNNCLAVVATKVAAIVTDTNDKITVWQSDGFDNVSSRYDVIFFVAPKPYLRNGSEEMLDPSEYDIDGKLMHQILSRVSDYLTPRGKMYVMFAINQEELKELQKRYAELSFKELYYDTHPYFILEITPKNPDGKKEDKKSLSSPAAIPQQPVIMQGRIFDRENILRERQISAEKTTVAFDLDDTLILLCTENGESFKDISDVDSSQQKSSPVILKKEIGYGGIDFRSLPIVTQAMTNLSANISSSAINRLSSVNLNTEWQGIERMALSGIKVSPERLKEYVQAGCVKGNIIQIRDKIILYISDLLRQEEELCVETDSLLRDILVMLESIRDSRKLKEVFLGEAIPVKG